jgi:hypothetical protein
MVKNIIRNTDLFQVLPHGTKRRESGDGTNLTIQSTTRFQTLELTRILLSVSKMRKLPNLLSSISGIQNSIKMVLMTFQPLEFKIN